MGQMTGLLIYGGSLGDFYALAMQTKPKQIFFWIRDCCFLSEILFIISRGDKIMQFYLDSLKGRMCLI